MSVQPGRAIFFPRRRGYSWFDVDQDIQPYYDLVHFKEIVRMILGPGAERLNNMMREGYISRARARGVEEDEIAERAYDYYGGYHLQQVNSIITRLRLWLRRAIKKAGIRRRTREILGLRRRLR